MSESRLICGDALAMLKTLPDASVQCCVTSPPYWGLRDYDVVGQIGLEATPAEFVARLTGVFDEVWRVLRPDGTLWLNLGDSYASAWAVSRRNVVGAGSLALGKRAGRPNRLVDGLKEKDLIGIPWRVAFALQDAGWYLRCDNIWAKPNPMPESVTDRPTRSHEYLFLLTKSPKYFYDSYAIKEPTSGTAHARGNGVNPKAGRSAPGSKQNASFSAAVHGLVSERNKRSVWTVPTQAYPEAHFATFPTALVEPCILAGSSDRACEYCGAPWARVLVRAMGTPESYKGSTFTRGKTGINGMGRVSHLDRTSRVSGGWAPTCKHANQGMSSSVVLDPFVGSGTVCAVATRLGRRSIGIDLSPAYLKLAEERIFAQCPETRGQTVLSFSTEAI